MGYSFNNKNDMTITNPFQKFLNRSNSKLKKIWVDKGSRFYNRLKKSCFQDNYIEQYLTFNEEK